MNVLDIFSGIGGFSLGLERAGMQTVAFCEIDRYCRSVLAKHWPGVPIHRDIRALRGIPLSGLVAGGESSGVSGHELEPCLRPDWIVVENIAHRWRAWVPELRRQLWVLGYASLPIRMRAVSLGANHKRARIFVIANADGERLAEFQRQLSKAETYGDVVARANNWWKTNPGVRRVDDGLSGAVDCVRSIGNAVVPFFPEIIGRAIMKARLENETGAKQP